MANKPYDPRLNEQNSSGTNILQGQTGPTSTPAPSGPAPQQPNPQQATAPRQSTQQKKGPSRSGMFTNLKSYIDKNKPQAQTMASAATKDFSKQASNIAQQAQKRKQDFQNKITARQSDVEAQKQFGQQMIQGAAQFQVQPGQKATDQTIAQAFQSPQQEGAQPTQQPTAQENLQRFQDIAQGRTVSDLTNVGDLDISEQAMRARQMQELAGKAGTEQGRRGLLEQTYGRDRAYTRGQAGLDDLILGGSRDAREQLVEATKGSAEGLQSQLQQARMAALEGKGQLSREARALGGDLQEMAQTEAQKQIQAAEQAAQEAYGQYGAEQEEFQRALRGEADLTQEMLDKYMSPQQQAAFKQKAMQDAEFIRQMEMGLKSGGAYGYRRGREVLFGGSKDAARDWFKSQGGNEYVENVLSNNAEYQQALKDNNSSKRWDMEKRARQQFLDQKANEAQARIQNQSVLDFLKGQRGAGLASRLSSNINEGDFTAQRFATEDQLARYEALAKMAGLGQEERGLNYLAQRSSKPQRGSLNIDNLRLKRIFG